MPRPFARGYYAGENGMARIRDYTRINPRLGWTAGGMVSTVGDLTKWGKVLATGTLLSRRLQAERMRFGNDPDYQRQSVRIGAWDHPAR
jgi:D-alanyl-D-alanine carboxypeptidase